MERSLFSARHWRLGESVGATVQLHFIRGSFCLVATVHTGTVPEHHRSHLASVRECASSHQRREAGFSGRRWQARMDCGGTTAYCLSFSVFHPFLYCRLGEPPWGLMCRSPLLIQSSCHKRILRVLYLILLVCCSLMLLVLACCLGLPLFNNRRLYLSSST